ncbi:hypothetical protein FCJ60_03440 [Burkholderia metallica]|nr:hypothetical protein [Burkholderia metallica]
MTISVQAGRQRVIPRTHPRGTASRAAERVPHRPHSHPARGPGPRQVCRVGLHRSRRLGVFAGATRRGPTGKRPRAAKRAR